MKRRATRDERIDSFEIEIGDLEKLIEILKKEFSNQNEVDTSIEMEFEEEEWTFENVNEIRGSEISRETVYQI